MAGGLTLQQCRFKGVEPETFRHESSEITGASIRDVGTETQEEVQVSLDVRG